MRALVDTRSAPFVFVFCLAIALRVAFAHAAHLQETSDAADYRDLAASMVERGEYGRVGNSGWDHGVTFQAYRPPGYPVARAALMLVYGPEMAPAMWLNIVSELVALAFVIATARRLLDERGALCAAALFAPIILFTGNLMTEFISMALWSVLMWAYVERLAAERSRHALWIGVVAAYALLVRPIAVIWLPVLAAQALIARPRAWRSLAALAIGPLVLVGAWTLRNYALFDSFVWSSTNLGVHNAYDFHIPWQRLVELRRSGLNEPEADRALQREVLAAASAHPDDTFWLLRDRLVGLFSVSERECPEIVSAREYVLLRSPNLLRLYDRALFVLRSSHVLAVTGLVVSLLNRRLRERTLAVPLLAFVTLQCLLSRGDARFIAPVLPILSIFAGGVLGRAMGVRRHQLGVQRAADAAPSSPR